MWSVIKESKGNQFRISFLSQLLLFYFLSSMRRGGCNVKLKQRVSVASHENSSMGWWTEEKATNLVCQHLCSENLRLFFFNAVCWHLLLVPTFQECTFLYASWPWETICSLACLLVLQISSAQKPRPPSWQGTKDKKCGRWLLFTRPLKDKQSSRFTSNDTPSTTSESSLNWPHLALSLYVTLHKRPQPSTPM